MQIKLIRSRYPMTQAENKKQPPTHDNAYKSLFSHPEMVRALLTGFVSDEIVCHFDLQTLEKQSGSYITDDLRDREDDIIWRVKFKQQWLYIYLILEFQSGIDQWMAVRIGEYFCLLCNDIIKSQQLQKSDLLPPVLPIVLYTGNKEWNAPLTLSELFKPVPKIFSDYQVKAQYFLIAENRFTDEELRSKDNLAAIMFRMENSQTSKQFEDALESLIEWTKRPEHDGLRRAFTIWIKRVLFPRKMPGQEIPDLDNLNEVRTMLERVDDWTVGARQEGMQQGMQKYGVTALLRQMKKKFGEIPKDAEERIEKADSDTLLEWSENVLSANTVDEVFH